MSRLYGALVVLGVVVVLTATGFLVNTNTAREVLTNLESACHLARNGRMDQAKAPLDQAQQKWDENMEIMLLFVSHGRLDRIEEAIHQAYDYLDSQERSLFLAKCSEAILQTEHLIHEEYPYVDNIF